MLSLICKMVNCSNSKSGNPGPLYGSPASSSGWLPSPGFFVALFLATSAAGVAAISTVATVVAAVLAHAAVLLLLAIMLAPIVLAILIALTIRTRPQPPAPVAWAPARVGQPLPQVGRGARELTMGDVHINNLTIVAGGYKPLDAVDELPVIEAESWEV